MVCTFFGHRDAPESVLPLLRDTVERLIRDRGADTFYVGCDGSFDRMAARVLQQMARKYPIAWAVVQSRLPAAGSGPAEAALPTVLPEGVELGPPRFAVDRRNRWMLDRADCVVTYVRCSAGGAAKFQALASRRGKTVLNLAGGVVPPLPPQP